MSFIKRKGSSTRRFLNLKELTDFSIVGYNNHYLIYYSLSPFNLSVLSKENIQAKVFDLMNLIKGIEVLEFLCLNGRENFRFNKINMRKRIDEETNPKIRDLLEQDLKQIDTIQVQTATARSFLIGIRIKHGIDNELHTTLNRIEKLFESHGLTIRKLSKDDLKTMLAVYYEQNVTTDRFEDIDGKQWQHQ
ncbi:hypothetical protein [Erysipelothrix anatis]|uniref:hypothetical protein n=1 Tax=Erysipelothrix anatis TaxID=2683713 RepID=UPI001359830F|nr:hypothetical protein [Erysipelothrix anatis]